MSHVLGYLYADYAAMVAVLGEPSPGDISDPDKIDAEWNVHMDGCVPVNVYSYHDVQPDHRHPPVTQPGVTVEWHVQAPSQAAFEALSRLVFGENGYTITRVERWPGDTAGRLEARAMTAPWLTASVVLTCDACAGEYFPQPPGKCSELGFDHPGDPHIAMVHPACEADFVANGFDVMPDPDEEHGPQLYCPHLD